MYIDRHTVRLDIVPFLKPAIEIMCYCFNPLPANVENMVSSK